MKPEARPSRDLEFASRIRMLVGDESVSAFALKCGVLEGSVRQYLTGTIPGLDKAMAIARAAGVRLEWLATGDGPMMVGEGTADGAGAAQGDDRPMSVEGAPPIDGELLSVCMEAVHKGLTLQGYDPSGWPVSKLAGMVANLYNEAVAMPEEEVKARADDMRRRQSAAAVERRDERRRA